MNEIPFWTVLTVALMVVSFLAMVATIVFRKKMSDETAHIFFGLIPLEFCIIFFGMPFFLALCFFLV